jgi:hypothetical protein
MDRWLTETLETLMKERVVDEQKAEHNKLKVSAYKETISRDLLVCQNNIYWKDLSWHNTFSEVYCICILT